MHEPLIDLLVSTELPKTDDGIGKKPALIPAAPKTLTRSLFESKDLQEYLDQLMQSSMEQIKREPDMLNAENVRLNRQLSNVAFSEYKAFLRAHQSCSEVRGHLVELTDNIDKVTGCIEPFSGSIKQLGSTADALKLERVMLERVLGHNKDIVEILDIPQLFDTFVRSGYYEEAMDLQLFVQRLPVRYPHLPIIKRIASQVDVSAGLMLTQLIQLLSGNAKLPLCIRTIGYLRRMEAFPEPELRLVFLQQRDMHLSHLLDSISELSSAEYLKKYIEISREHFFDIITQYKAIFSDSQPIFLSSVAGAVSTASIFDSSASYATQSILASYVSHSIAKFVSVLRHHLMSDMGVTAVNSVLTQTMYYGMSLGRVGIDFRQTVAEVFEAAVERIVRLHIATGLNEFVDWCQRTRLRGIFTPTTKFSIDQSTTNKAIKQPPATFFSYQPLGHLLNAFLSAFNQLRILPCLLLVTPLLQFIKESLLLSCQIIKEVSAQEWGKWSDEQRLEVQDASRVMADILIPYVLDAFLKGVYSNQICSVDSIDPKSISVSIEHLASVARKRVAGANSPGDSTSGGMAGSNEKQDDIIVEDDN